MAKVIHKGIKEDGTIDTEVIQTPALITELIGKFPNMCEAAIRIELEEIRKSSEMDERIRKDWGKILKDHKKRRDEIEKRLTEGIHKRIAMARFFESMDDKETSARCEGFAHAFAVALSWVQEDEF